MKVDLNCKMFIFGTEIYSLRVFLLHLSNSRFQAGSVAEMLQQTKKGSLLTLFVTSCNHREPEISEENVCFRDFKPKL